MERDMGVRQRQPGQDAWGPRSWMTLPYGLQREHSSPTAQFWTSSLQSHEVINACYFMLPPLWSCFSSSTGNEYSVNPCSVPLTLKVCTHIPGQTLPTLSGTSLSLSPPLPPFGFLLRRHLLHMTFLMATEKTALQCLPCFVFSLAFLPT